MDKNDCYLRKYEVGVYHAGFTPGQWNCFNVVRNIIYEHHTLPDLTCRRIKCTTGNHILIFSQNMDSSTKAYASSLIHASVKHEMNYYRGSHQISKRRRGAVEFSLLEHVEKLNRTSQINTNLFQIICSK